MSKTIEELAKEYVIEKYFKYVKRQEDDNYELLIEDFISGYQAAAPQWISVKDRLPEVEQYVVIFWNDMPQISYLTVWEHFAISAGGITPEPSHWMLLPKSPEEK